MYGDIVTAVVTVAVRRRRGYTIMTLMMIMGVANLFASA